MTDPNIHPVNITIPAGTRVDIDLHAAPHPPVSAAAVAADRYAAELGRQADAAA